MADSGPASMPEQHGPSPLLHAPDLWLMQLIQRCDDPKLRLALFQTNKHLRDLVLQSSPDAHVTLQVDQPLAGRPSRQQAAPLCQLLHHRNGKATRVTLWQSEWVHDSTEPVLQVVQCLRPHLITHFKCTLLQYYLPAQQTAILTAITTTCPHLNTLHLDRLGTPLPSPAQLPQTTDLHVRSHLQPVPLAAVLTSIAAYLPQLHKLHLHSWHQPTWSQLFAIPAPSLTHLTVNRWLDANLLTLLLTHAPALQVLSVAALDLPDSFANRTWSLQELFFDGMVVSEELDRLPKTVGGRPLDIHLSSQGCLMVPLHAGALQRRLEWRFPAPVTVALTESHHNWWDEEMPPPFPYLFPVLASINTPHPITITVNELLMESQQDIKRNWRSAVARYPKLRLEGLPEDSDSSSCDSGLCVSV